MLRVVISLLCLVTFSAALYGPKSDVILLTKANFEKELMDSNHVWLVEFFAPWCGHCKSLAPAWEQAAKKLKGIVKIAAVDADAEREIGGRFGIKGFPTIKAFKSPIGGDNKKKGKTPIDFNGGRTAKDIIAYATSLLPTKNVAKVASADALENFQKSELPKALLFTEKATSPPLFTAMSLEFHERMAFAFVPKSADAVVATFEVTSYPKVVVVTSSGEQVVFDGELAPEKLAAFLKTHALPGKETGKAQPEEKEEKPKATPKPKEEPVPEEPAEVYELTSDAVLDERCANKRNLCLVAFLDPLSDESSHQNYLKVLLEVAEKNKKLMSVVWVDVAKQPDFFTHFGSSDIPSLRLWNKKKSSVATVVAALTASGLNKFIADATTNKVRMNKLAAPPALVEGGVKYEAIEEEPFVDEEKHTRDEL